MKYYLFDMTLRDSTGAGITSTSHAYDEGRLAAATNGAFTVKSLYSPDFQEAGYEIATASGAVVQA